MLTFYARLALRLPGLLFRSGHEVHTVIWLIATAVTAFGPGLASMGEGALAVYAAKVPGWWLFIPIGFLVLVGSLKLNYETQASTERELERARAEREALQARLDDEAERQRDADELGRLRKTMRKRYYEWLEDQKQPGRFPDAREKGLGLQTQVAAILERAYGFDLADRFLTAADTDSANPFGLLLETQEYEGRIRRLGGIVQDIRSGTVKRSVRLRQQD